MRNNNAYCKQSEQRKSTPSMPRGEAQPRCAGTREPGCEQTSKVIRPTCSAARAHNTTTTIRCLLSGTARRAPGGGGLTAIATARPESARHADRRAPEAHGKAAQPVIRHCGSHMPDADAHSAVPQRRQFFHSHLCPNSSAVTKH
jgi:hypothetical protein